MNIRCVGVQYVRTNPERFIESISGDLWARYLAEMSQQGTWAEALVIQAVADAFHLTINIVEPNERFYHILLLAQQLYQDMNLLL